MKLTSLLSLWLLLSISFAFGQQSSPTGRVTYEKTKSFKLKIRDTFNLAFSRNQSLYYQVHYQSSIGANQPAENVMYRKINPQNHRRLLKKVRKKIKRKYPETYMTSTILSSRRISVCMYGHARKIIQIDLNKDILATQNALIYSHFNHVFRVRESVPEIRWRIKKDTKTIKGYEAQRAVGKFRGRKYTVWFTREIPVPFGPWKLNGLPGLILKAQDKTGTYTFEAIAVDYPKSEALKEEKIQFNPKARPVTLQKLSVPS